MFILFLSNLYVIKFGNHVFGIINYNNFNRTLKLLGCTCDTMKYKYLKFFFKNIFFILKYCFIDCGNEYNYFYFLLCRCIYSEILI